jgi:hypothetical protein
MPAAAQAYIFICHCRRILYNIIRHNRCSLTGRLLMQQ